MPQAENISSILKDDFVSIADQVFYRRVRWPDSVAAPPMVDADVAQLHLQPFDPADPETFTAWTTEFIPSYSDGGGTHYPDDYDDSHLDEDTVSIRDQVLDLSNRVVDVTAVLQRSRGSADFTVVLQDDADSSLQNLVRPNDVFTWYRLIWNTLRPDLGVERVLQGSYLADDVPVTVSAEDRQIAVRGRDSLKMLMLDYFVGNFQIDRIDETQLTVGGAKKVKMRLVREASDRERIVFVVDHDYILGSGVPPDTSDFPTVNYTPIPPTYNWADSPAPQLFRVNYRASAGHLRLKESDGAWKILLGQGQVWFNREWFDDNLQWIDAAGVRKSYQDTPDPLSAKDGGGNYIYHPKYDVWIAYTRNILPEDQIIFTLGDAGGGSPVGNDGTKDYIQLDPTTTLPANIAKYRDLATINFLGNLATDHTLILTDADLTHKRLYTKVRKISDGTDSPLSTLALTVGTNGYVGETNRPETRLRQVLKAGGFQDKDSAKPFYIQSIESVFSTYFWSDATGNKASVWETITHSGDDLRDINGEFRYPQSFALDGTAADHVYSEIRLSSYRRTIALFIDLAAPGVGATLEFAVYDTAGGTWVSVPGSAILSDSTNGLTQGGYVEFDPQWIKAHMTNYNAAVATNASAMGIPGFAYTDVEYPYQFILSITLGAGTGPVFASIRPCAPLQIGAQNYKKIDKTQHWDVLERTLRDFLPPNYDWKDNGSLGVVGYSVVQAETPQYEIDKFTNIERESGDADLYTDVIAKGRRRDLVNLLSPYNGRKPILWVPYQAQGWNGTAYVNKDLDNTSENSSPEVCTYKTHPDRVDDEDSKFWIGDGIDPLTGLRYVQDTLTARSFFYHQAEGIKNLLDNAVKTVVRDYQQYGNISDKYFSTDAGGILKEDVLQSRCGSLDGIDFLEENQCFDDHWILAAMFDATYEIGTVYFNPGKLDKGLNQTGDYAAGYTNQYMILEVWKSETTDDPAEYEKMIDTFSLGPSEAKEITSDDFVSNNRFARFLRVKCVEAAKSLDISDVLNPLNLFGSKHKRGRRIYAMWAMATWRAYEDDVIYATATLGVDPLAGNYTPDDLARDARWRRKLRPRTKVLDNVDEYANTEADTLADAIAWLREGFRKFLSFRITACRPDLKVGDTVRISHALCNETSVWAGMFNDTADAADAQAEARLDMLVEENSKGFLVEEVTHSKDGYVTARVVAYRGSS